MKPGDKVYKVGRSFDGNPEMESATVSSIGKSDPSKIKLVDSGLAWGCRGTVRVDECHATPVLAAAAYLAECAGQMEAATKKHFAARELFDRLNKATP